MGSPRVVSSMPEWLKATVHYIGPCEEEAMLARRWVPLAPCPIVKGVSISLCVMVTTAPYCFFTAAASADGCGARSPIIFRRSAGC